MKKNNLEIVIKTTVSLVVIYWFTINPSTRNSAVFLTLLAALALGFLAWKKRRNAGLKKYFNPLFIVFMLLLVGTTGWNLSPFYYLIYILAIYVGIIYGLTIGTAFILTIVGLFLGKVGEIDMAYDLLNLFSLLSVIPVIYLLKMRAAGVKNTLLKSDKPEGDNLWLIKQLEEIRNSAFLLSRINKSSLSKKHQERIIELTEEVKDKFRKD